MLRRLALSFYDAACLVIVAAVVSTGFALPAYAYIDPSVMTYTIQAIAGVAVALSAVLGVAFRRGRKVVIRLLDIDENAKKHYEEPIRRIDQQTPEATGAQEPEQRAAESPLAAFVPTVTTPLTEAAEAAVEKVTAANAEKAVAAAAEAEPTRDFGSAVLPPAEEASSVQAGPSQTEPETSSSAPSASEAEPSAEPSPKRKKRRFFDKRAYKPTWKVRLACGLLAGLFFTFTIFFVAPLEIVGGSSGSLVYKISDVWWVLLPTDVAIIAGIAAVLTLLRGRAFNVMLVVVFAVGLCAYVQALVLNVGLPAADGAAIFWSDYMVEQVVSTAVWVVIVVALVLFSLHNRVRAQGVVVILSVALVVVQAVGLASLVIAPPAPRGQGGVDAMNANIDPHAEIVMTEDQMFTVAPKNNVIVFVLDTFDTAYLRRIMKQDPNLLDELTGFTNYENATSAMIPTRFALPFMMTGQMPRFDEPFSQYKRERYARGTFIDSMYNAGYSIGLYTDSLTISALPDEEQYAITSKTVNMHELPNSMIDFGGTLYSLYQMGLYRDVPWSLKWGFWYYTDQINSSFVAYDPEAPPEETVYVMDDIRYYNQLCNLGLSVVDDGHTGAFRFIHMLGSHYPFNYDENVNDLGQDNSDVFKQSRGALRIVSEYIKRLKDLGVYDDTTIIVTADHGYWTITEEPIEETSTPIMFVKPAQSAELDARPIVVDEKPVSHLDLQPTVLDAMGLDWSEYAERPEYPGYSMFGDIDPARKRLYLTTDSLPDLTETWFREYLIDGNALEFANWSQTGRFINAQD